MILACIDLLVDACLTLCNFDSIMHAINELLISIIIFGINLRFLLKYKVMLNLMIIKFKQNYAANS